MQRSESIAALAAAMVKAQTAMGSAKRDASNPFFKSKYADLASVREACLPLLNANGLCVMQFARGTAEGVEVETMLVHTSGEWISDSLAVPVSKNDAQGYGSAISYARRYGLAALPCLATEDDDGNAAAASLNNRQAEPRPVPSKKKPNKEELLSEGITRMAGVKTLEQLRTSSLWAQKQGFDHEQMMKFNAVWEKVDAELRKEAPA